MSSGDGRNRDHTSAGRRFLRVAALTLDFAVLAFVWTVAMIRGSTLDYFVAAMLTVVPMVRRVRRWVVRRYELPEASPDEAYVSRLRRWRRGRNAGIGI